MTTKNMLKEGREKSSLIRKILLIAFALSGFTALVYEVVWARQLQVIFGSTIYAFSTLLAGFMTGFALGAYLFGKISHKFKNPCNIFALLELGIGAYALLAIYLVKLMPNLYLFMLGLPGFTVMQFMAAFVFVLIPATLFGATWPVFTMLYSTGKNHGKTAGTIYFSNSTGCAIGAIAAGFVIIPLLGLAKTLILAALLNILIAILVFTLKRREKYGT
ncbi:MAG: fused MFS/spermidine synthase [Nanoarchaeota archaeon]|nr:fused MFS/spermidine synthase [Nanoarchaeota archaeon]